MLSFRGWELTKQDSKCIGIYRGTPIVYGTSYRSFSIIRNYMYCFYSQNTIQLYHV